MKILNFGSLNIDYVYSVDHFVQPGETLASNCFDVFPGGKGFNQTIALARAGATVFHAGCIGGEGMFLKELLEKENVSTEFIKTVDVANGHAIIQVDSNGENSIILFGGANQQNSLEFIDEVLSDFGAGDVLLIQNEINNTAELIAKAKTKGLYIVFNPAPMTDAVLGYPLELVDLFVVNETEAAAITEKTSFEDMKKVMRTRFADAATIFTLGANGSVFQCGDVECVCDAIDVGSVVDTTAAGDTFIGYFLALRAKGQRVDECLKGASKASGIAVSRKGASSSIPYLNEL
ncbi:MAG: ribokinase [Kiritimatiellae bacterium]|jgi:ribokinase|nr:ribokinase [Kiritimatiellia bacterium]